MALSTPTRMSRPAGTHNARSGLAALASAPHTTRGQPAVNRITEPAICAAPTTSAYVPIGALESPVTNVVLARRSVLGTAWIGSDVLTAKSR